MTSPPAQNLFWRFDRYRVSEKCRRGAIERAGNFHDGVGGEVVDGFVAFPFRLLVHVDRELMAVGTLNHEGVAGGIDTDDARIEFIDVGVGVRRRDYLQTESRSDRASDLAVAIQRDGLADVEFETQAIDIASGNHKRSRQIDGDGGSGQTKLRIRGCTWCREC